MAAAATRAPHGFVWGSAGAAYQIEGGNFASDLWVLEHMKPSLFATPSGDADDTYNRIDEDIALAAAFGFNAHRLSIEWSRIEPEQGQISYASLAYYRRVLESLHKHGLAPVVTFIHTTVPRWFAANGGFTTEDGIAPFASYCQLVTEHMGDLITASATFNEPNINALLSWEPAMRNLGPQLDAMRKTVAAQLGNPRWASPLLSDFRVQQPIMIEAHARAYDAIKAASRGSFPVGVTLATERRRAAGRRRHDRRAGQAGPGADALDQRAGATSSASRTIPAPSSDPTPTSPRPAWPPPRLGYPYAPDALEKVIRMVASQTRRPIYVTENGVATEDDAQRVAFIKVAVQGVLNCLARRAGRARLSALVAAGQLGMVQRLSAQVRPGGGGPADLRPHPPSPAPTTSARSRRPDGCGVTAPRPIRRPCSRPPARKAGRPRRPTLGHGCWRRRSGCCTNAAMRPPPPVVVADEAGVSRGAMQHQFPTRTDLMLFVVRAVFDEEMAVYAERLRAVPDPKAQALALPELVWEVLSRPSGVAVLEILQGSRSDPVLAERLAPLQAQIEREMT